MFRRRHLQSRHWWYPTLEKRSIQCLLKRAKLYRMQSRVRLSENHRMVSDAEVCTLCSGSIDGEIGAKLDVEKQSALKRAVSVVLRLQLEDSASVCISCAENVVAVEQRMGRWVGNLSEQIPTLLNPGGSTPCRLCVPSWRGLNQKFRTRLKVFIIVLNQ